jgi:hypothetical protein
MRKYSSILLLAAAVALGEPSEAKRGLLQKGTVAETRYCLQPSGWVVIQVRLLINVKNDTQTPIILTRAATISSYTLRRTETAQPKTAPLLSFAFPKQEAFDASGLDIARPPANLFEIVEPGASVERIVLAYLPFGRLQVARSRSSESYWLTVRLQHWMSSEGAAASLQRAWSHFGLLWIDSAGVAPIKLIIERSPKVERCVGRVD